MAFQKGERMNIDPITFEIKIDDFDFDILPIPIDGDLLKENRELRKKAVSLYYEDYFKHAGGEIEIEIVAEYIKIFWSPLSYSEIDMAIEQAIKLLEKRAYSHAEPILRAVATRYPDRKDVLFNYGMMLSDQGRLDEAIKLLFHLTSIDTENANAWNALGIAYLRNGQTDEAKKCLRQSYDLDSENGYTLRNLGALLAKENPKEAFPFLEKAAKLLPDDQQTQYGYALCLMQMSDKQEKADAIFKKAIDISPYSEISELCRQERTKIAQSTMRGSAPNGLRMDVVMYCQAALKRFEELGLEKAKQITAEIGLLGRQGLDINNPDKKYTLHSLPGEFTGLQLVSYMYVGIKQMDNKMDAGINFSKEYALALNLFEGIKDDQ